MYKYLNSVVDMEKDFEVTRRTVAAVDEYSIDNSDNANPNYTCPWWHIHI